MLNNKGPADPGSLGDLVGLQRLLGDLLYVLNGHGVEQKDTNVNGTGFNLYTYTFELGNTAHVGGPYCCQVQDGARPVRSFPAHGRP